ncbi:restriction endonuclease subunit S [Neptunomonas phycophila]|uniref:restriction endonuclease subunit S n=1 Tax=Neptunomonas phycophila TaxID=1572645 RepID=UPI0030FCE48C
MNNTLNGELGILVKAGGGKIHTGPFGSQLHASDYVAEGIPCIMPANMKNSRVDLSNIAYITESDAQRLKKYIVKENDIVYSRRGDVTQKALIRKSEEGYFCGTGCLLLRPGKKFDARFLTYYLSISKIQNWIVSQAVGATMPNLNTGILSSIPFHGPKKPEQERVANVLSAIDQKIELNNRINAELEAMAKTLYDYWYVQFDFPDANGKPYKTSGGKMDYNSTLKREIPEGWDVKKLEKVTSLIRRGISPKYTDEGGISVLNQKCVRDQKISFDDVRRHRIELDDGDERLLKPFDVVVNSTGVGTLGRVAYVKRLLEKKTTVDSHVSIIRAKPELLSPQYMAWNLMRHQSVIESAANGSTGQVELSKSFLEDIDIIIPSDSIVKRFEEFVTSLVPELAARELENEQLIQLRNWLLPMLMNGQVTVT